MRLIASVVVVAVGLAAFAGGAQAARTKDVTTDDGRIVHEINNKDVMICRYIAPAGSHLTAAVCHTAQQWKDMHDYSREYLEDIHRNAGYQAGPMF